MRNVIKAALVLLFAAAIAGWLYRTELISAQNQSPPYMTANQQAGDFPTLVNLNCAGCHGAGKTLPNLGGELFHKDAHKALDQSVHGGRARCTDCHTRNGDMATDLPAEDPNSTVNRANMAETCGKCHKGEAASYHLSIHGTRRPNGDIWPASCADCHGSHGILPPNDPNSLLSRANTADTCSKCHSSIAADYQTSSHGMMLASGDQKAPNCTTCHTAVSHLSAPKNTRDFAVEMIANCSNCHKEQAPSYRDTFHGQATALQFKMAATCADCHTPHRNLPASDPRSSVNSANLVQTCSRCHTNANPNFATYDPHPRPDDPARSELVYWVSHFMEWLLLGTFSFFGLHTVLWIQRSLVAWFTEKRHAVPDDEKWVVRFPRVHRLTHVLIVISFILLAATGLPLMYYYTSWGQTFERFAGGLGVTRVIHRICAVITIVYAAIHISYVVKKAIFERKLSILYGPDSMVPRWQDVIDLFNMARWFLYLGPRPKLDRWTYWEKFDYFAVFWGVPVIGLSGLMLWFPTFFTSFLPGVVLNLAMIIHSEEALLATAFIFAFHFFHNHLRPENFPMDTVIFTGRMRLSRFKEERATEYERLVSEGKLESVLAPPPTRRVQLASKIFGFIAYISGLIMVVAILATLLLVRQ